MYLEEVNKKLNSLSAAIGSANQEQIAAAIGEFKPLKNMATQLNHETEELMQMLGVSDEEANYRYRKF